MKIKQFEDQELSQYSYGILSEREMVLIDPARDITPYIDFANNHQAKIIGVIETHPHADFISSHLEIHKTTGATIYCSKLLAADYPHTSFDDGDMLACGNIKLQAVNTPGHSPDSISIVLEYEGKDKAVFTGDTLFIGDCGRPDLRENAGNLTAKREELARQMFYSLRDKLMVLDDDVLVYPAHGAGTLCGKSLSEASSSTMGAEKLSNWSLQEMTEEAFIKALNENQPFVPKYFPFDVGLNKKGAESLSNAMRKVQIGAPVKDDFSRLDASIIVIDTRAAEEFKTSHLPSSINIMANGKFETWLGSIISPEEPFYLAAEDSNTLTILIKRIAKIGYEGFIKEAFVLEAGSVKSPALDLEAFKKQAADYTIIDIRNSSEVKEKAIFQNALNIPLPELRERIAEIPEDKPIVVHCAGGYRSAAGSSIVADYFPNLAVYDLSTAIKEF